MALALGTGGFAYTAMAAAADGAARYGDAAPVMVAARDLPAGHVLEGGDVRVVELPAAARPERPLTGDPEGRALRAPVAAGQVLARSQVAGAGTSGLRAALPEGARAVAVPRGDAPLELAAGDRVDVLAIDPEVGAAARAAADVEVLAVDELTATLAVDGADLESVATALVAGTVVLALSG